MTVGYRRRLCGRGPLTKSDVGGSDGRMSTTKGSIHLYKIDAASVWTTDEEARVNGDPQQRATRPLDRRTIADQQVALAISNAVAISNWVKA
jgi:hypothetical protein